MLAAGATDNYFARLLKFQNDVDPKVERVKNCAMEGLSTVLYDAALERVRKDKNLSENDFDTILQNELNKMEGGIKISGRKICLPPAVVQRMIDEKVITREEVDYEDVLALLKDDQFKKIKEQLYDMKAPDNFLEQCIKAAKLSLVYKNLSNLSSPKLKDLEGVCTTLGCDVVEYEYQKTYGNDTIIFQPKKAEKFVPSLVLKDNKINRELLRKYQTIKSKFTNVKKVLIGNDTVHDLVKNLKGLKFSEKSPKRTSTSSRMISSIFNRKEESDKDSEEPDYLNMTVAELEAEVAKL
jgi:Asp-tRNA(Asn)/Glu-tRNA(Gln) amidotransferase C subunit/DNA-binding phage protein